MRAPGRGSFWKSMSLVSKKNLTEKRKALPIRPGVYLFKNSQDKIIYIGKALSLKNRVASYFNSSVKDQKTARLVSQIKDLDFIQLNSEFEALVLEAKLVREHLPKFNIQLRDDKHPLYIGLTREEYPRIFALRRPELTKGLKIWFGPFLSGADVRKVLKFTRRIFPYRSCVKLPAKPCLYYHLKLCPGMCAFSVPDYKIATRRLQLLFGGRTGELVKQLTREMKALAVKQKFEEAAVVKYQLQALSSLSQGWHSIPVEKISKAKALEEIRQLLIKHQGVDLGLVNNISSFTI